MKLVSFDVGIKNLAYCIFDVSNSKFNVIDWNVISLCSNDFPCTNCGTISIYNKDNMYFCRKCAKKTGFIVPCKLLKGLKKLKVNCLDKVCDTYNIPFDKKMKKFEKLELCETFIKEKCLLTNASINANEVSLIDLGIAIRDNLNTHEFLSATKILIENQISPIANRMKTIQGMLAQFFIMNGIEDIMFVSASNKLKQFSTSKITYAERKKLSIEVTKKVITSTCISWQNHFSTHKKKDDLADSFLQGFWYITK